jgi:hypothetical protein
MKVGDLVKLKGWESTRGIVLQLIPGCTKHPQVYWLSHKQYGFVDSPDDLEVISESR